MPQCAACGKFMGSKVGVTCPKCSSRSHHECVRIPSGVTVAETWRCGECQSKTPKGRDPSTPIRSMQDTYLTQIPPGVETTTSISAMASAPVIHSVDVDIVRLLREEMRSEFEKIRNLVTSEFKLSQDNMFTVSEEVRELKREISATRSIFNERLDTFEARIASLELARETALNPPNVSLLEQTLADVKMQLNDREQDYLLNDVVITGIPESKGENPTHLTLLLSKKMGMEIDERDIVMAEREGAPRRPKDESTAPLRSRRIAVRFSRRSTRDAYLQAARVRRGLTTTELNIESAPARIYVNERLTRLNSQLFAKAREECRRHLWKYCWSREGRIYVRREHGESYSRIRGETDIMRIFGVGSV